MHSRRIRSAFTLIEVLVVVAIIALLVSILLPSLNRAREQARSTMCKANEKSLGLASITYVHEFKRLPGTQSAFYEQMLSFGKSSTPAWWGIPRNTNLKQTNYVWDGVATSYGGGRTDPAFIADCPRRGTLYKYARDEKLYLCPSDRPGQADDTPAGGGGNGRNTYSMNGYIGFSNPDKMVGLAKAADGRRFQKHWRATEMFLFVEEHPNYNKNTNRTGSWILEGNFNGPDKISTRHNLALGTNLSSNVAGGTGRTNLLFLDGHVESPMYTGLTDAYVLFKKLNMPVNFNVDGGTDYRGFLKGFMYDLGPKPPW